MLPETRLRRPARVLEIERARRSASHPKIRAVMFGSLRPLGRDEVAFNAGVGDLLLSSWRCRDGGADGPLHDRACASVGDYVLLDTGESAKVERSSNRELRLRSCREIGRSSCRQMLVRPVWRGDVLGTLGSRWVLGCPDGRALQRADALNDARDRPRFPLCVLFFTSYGAQPAAAILGSESLFRTLGGTRTDKGKPLAEAIRAIVPPGSHGLDRQTIDAMQSLNWTSIAAPAINSASTALLRHCNAMAMLFRRQLRCRLALIQQALTKCEMNKERWFEAEVNATEGEVRSRRADT